MNFWETIFLFFAFQAFILSFLFFFKKKGDKIANKLLSVFAGLFGYNILHNALYWSDNLLSSQFIHLNYTVTFPWVLYGPILFFYARRVIHKSSFKIFDLAHFIPFFFIVINRFRFYFTSTEEKINIINNGNATDLFIYKDQYTIKIIVVLMLSYCIYIGFSLKNYLRSRNQSRWLSWLTISFSGYVLSFISYFVLVSFDLLSKESDYFIGFSMIFFIGLLTYFGFVQPDVFNGLSMDNVIPFKKYQKTGLKENLSIEYKSKLIDVMENEKPYLDNELRLDHLADKLNLSRHHISQVINEHFDSNFFDFINSFRIEEAKRMLNNNDELNISDVLYSSGFNNRVSFYKAFKKFTRVTPSEFKSLNEQNSNN